MTYKDAKGVLPWRPGDEKPEDSIRRLRDGKDKPSPLHVLVYVAGPYNAPTDWGIECNIRRAEAAGINVWTSGFVALCPHKNTAHFGGLCPNEVWLQGDLEILSRCDIIFMVQGWEASKGATAELQFAREHDIPAIFDDGISSFKKLFEEFCIKENNDCLSVAMQKILKSVIN